MGKILYLLNLCGFISMNICCFLVLVKSIGMHGIEGLVGPIILWFVLMFTGIALTFMTECGFAIIGFFFAYGILNQVG